MAQFDLCGGSEMGRICVLIFVVLFVPFVIFGQSEDCSTEPSLIGQTLPINVLVTPMADDLAMTGLSCSPFDTNPCGFQDGFDTVVCFTPSNDCEVVYQIATGSTNVAGHVFAGDCMEPTECLVSDNADTFFSIFLDSGTQYCFVAERCGAINMNVFIGDVNGTDCGVFLDPDFAFPFCPEVLTAWNQENTSPCTGLDRYTVLDAIAFLDGSCACDFPTNFLRALKKVF